MYVQECASNGRYFMLYLYLSMMPISMPIIPYRHPMSAYLSILAFSINQPIYLYCINQIIQLILFLSFSISFCMCISEILIQVSVWVQRYFTNLQLLEQGHLFFPQIYFPDNFDANCWMWDASNSFFWSISCVSAFKWAYPWILWPSLAHSKGLAIDHSVVQ